MTRESEMVVIYRNDAGVPTIWCDPEIVDLVTALNTNGLRTIASCSGHGYRPGFIALADGRWLMVATDAERAIIDRAFPIDINGDFRGNAAELDKRPARGETGPVTGKERDWMRSYEVSLNRRADVEDVLTSVANGKRGPLSQDECRELAAKLGVPDMPPQEPK